MCFFKIGTTLTMVKGILIKLLVYKYISIYTIQPDKTNNCAHHIIISLWMKCPKILRGKINTYGNQNKELTLTLKNCDKRFTKLVSQ